MYEDVFRSFGELMCVSLGIILIPISSVSVPYDLCFSAKEGGGVCMYKYLVGPVGEVGYSLS